MESIDKKLYKNYLTLHKSMEKNIYNLEEIKIKIRPSFAKINIYKKYLFGKDLSILELGSGLGEFASVCKHFKIKNYIGVDISDEQLNYSKKLFPEYKFFKKDIIKYLKNNTKEHDLIVMEHVFEHFELEDQILIIKLILKNLKKNGLFINTMINTDAYFKGGGFYGDITHKALHSEGSLNQVLKLSGLENNQIEHFNSIQGNNLIQYTFHKCFVFFSIILLD